MIFKVVMPLLGTVLVATNVMAECRFGKRVVTGPTGKTIVACLDGKYTTCLRDSQRAGYSYDHAKRFCDTKREQGRIR